ncbi:hypothetical protein JAAARDRAFT_28919 [Jaapia argillacea MUCL 33604]|uniref:DH domain-containing protein n=1 Tax=Jaapia argillacea MUCL 33604 TaxID=933084 RepID=A0A067Q7F2_9AGAM|nr:hypothetical protein JAAARDRAFT_28919 [Jaapia argillacea MUCL 33604]
MSTAMASTDGATRPGVSFPSTDSPHPLSPPPPSSYLPHRPPHLPFRRISLPTAPTLQNLNRQSVVSLASFDSLPEDGTPSPGNATGPLGSGISGVLGGSPKSVVRKSRSRPSSVELRGKSRRKEKEKDRDAHSLVRDQVREEKRRKIIHEFYETERSYVDGLELIYSHFLTPVIESLETPVPYLDRAELTSVFSNFIDIWNLHRSFFSSLSTYLNSSFTASTSSNPESPSTPPPLSPILLSHFPYLSLYTPFVTSFSTAVSSLNDYLVAKPYFAAFIAKQEAHERCGRLKLRDWLLTIVQRCPRYLLLLKDLIGCTDPDDPEYASLTAVHTLVSKITISLNTSLHTHAQTLSLLALQRSTPNLPPNFQLITPGRTFLRRSPLLQLERSSVPKEREFLLFSDCLIWLVSADKGGDGEVEHWEWGGVKRPGLNRGRSRSEAELPRMQQQQRNSSSSPSSPGKMKPSSSPPGSSIAPKSPTKKKTRYASSGAEERWVYKGHVDLVDLEVVVSPPREPGEERRFEILSPSTSFAVYASSEQERDDWSLAIRNAKASLLVSLNVMHPHSTLTSSQSNHHLRRALEALPHLPADDHKKPKRGRVQHFVPAIWIPDGKTESCMRCGRTFGWRRRRHHCRLCGRCVCAGCSGSTFFISDPNSKDSKPARACDACYETVFPVIDSSSGTLKSIIPPSNSNGTLTSFPYWQSISMPSLPLSGPGARASALMAIGSPKRALHRIDDVVNVEGTSDGSGDGSRGGGGGGGGGGSPMPRIRVKPPSRPRSYTQILEDFEERNESPTLVPPSISSRPSSSRGAEDSNSIMEEQEGVVIGDFEDESDYHPSPLSPSFGSSLPPTPTKEKKREDTARRHKRFSLPMVALSTTAVTSKSGEEGSQRRYSLVVGASKGHLHQQQYVVGHLHGHEHGAGHYHQTSGEVERDGAVGLGEGRRGEERKGKRRSGLGNGAAALKLGELLGRKRVD